jgi:signal transduction histidine kinase
VTDVQPEVVPGSPGRLGVGILRPDATVLSGDPMFLQLTGVTGAGDAASVADAADAEDVQSLRSAVAATGGPARLRYRRSGPAAGAVEMVLLPAPRLGVVVAAVCDAPAEAEPPGHRAAAGATAAAAAAAIGADGDDVLTRVSHDLRTPLQSVLGLADLLDEEASAEDRHEWVIRIRQAGEHMIDLVDGILDAARTGQVLRTSTPIPVDDVLDEVLAILDPVAAKRSVVLVRGAPWGGLAPADPVRLRQVMVNLVDNAIKYNRVGGTVSVWWAEHDTKVRLSVADTGIGIPPDRRHEIFEPFVRVVDDVGGIPGSGLGLSTVRAVVEAMGGTIGVDSTVGVGSTFWVELPVSHAAYAELDADPGGAARRGS